MREAFVGFDSAWAGKAPGGIAYATFEDGRLNASIEPQLVHFEQAARIIERLRDECGYVLVAIDQPTLVPNETGMRPVERVAASLVSSLDGGVQPAFRGKRAMFGLDAPIWKFLDRIGARENPPAARTAKDGLHLMEVFPALALPALEPRIMARGHAACYNPKNRNFSLSDWRLVVTAVRRHADALCLASLSRWAGEIATVATPTKSHQDLLDAAVCLLVALCWRRAPRERSAVIGDSRTGYVVTPVSPASREILERVADEKDVSIDVPWPRDVERPLGEAAGTGLYREARMDRRPVRRNTSWKSGGGEYPCPIPSCSKVFHGSRGGWDAHVGSLRKHPDWHPDVSDAEERKRIFRDEYGDWFHARQRRVLLKPAIAFGRSVTDSRRRRHEEGRRNDMSLPYDMGNAGDLLKHGVLAEFVRWQCESNGSFRFLDPFGGEPWGAAGTEVARRVQALPESCALRSAQSEIDRDRYYGSGLVVRRVADACGCADVRVLVSDRDPAKRKRLQECGLSMLIEDFPGGGASGYDGYAAFDEIVGGAKDGDLVLLDPFHEFLRDEVPAVVPRMAEMAEWASVLLFALNLTPNNRVGQRFDDLLENHVPGAWRMICPPLRDTGVKGESTYHAEVILAARAFRDDARRRDVAALWMRLREFSRHLAAALGLPEDALAPRKVRRSETMP